MKKRNFYFIPLGIFLIGIIIGSFLDLNINKSLYFPGNAYGMGFAAFGPWIGYAFLVFTCGFIFRFAIKEKNIYAKIGMFILAIVGYGVSAYLSAGEVTSINAFDCEDWKWLWIIIAVIVFSGCFYLGNIYGRKTEDKRILFAFLILLLFFVIDLVPLAQILKNVMRRPRYRVIAEGLFENKAIFMNWWQPYKAYGAMFEKFGTTPSFSEQFKSFPSGHTSVAGILIFGLPYLSLIEPKLKNKEGLLFGIGLGFTILMAFSRMTMGAHYLTDVSFGGLIMTVCSIFANEINLKFFIKETEEIQG